MKKDKLDRKNGENPVVTCHKTVLLKKKFYKISVLEGKVRLKDLYVNL